MLFMAANVTEFFHRETGMIFFQNGNCCWWLCNKRQCEKRPGPGCIYIQWRRRGWSNPRRAARGLPSTIRMGMRGSTDSTMAKKVPGQCGHGLHVPTC